MDGEATRESIQVLVACNWSALTAEQQERQRDLYRQLRADVEEVQELEDGYAFRYSTDSGGVLLAVAEFVANERLCCPFFEFGITVERAGGPMWLRMTGAGKPSSFWRRRWASVLEGTAIPSVGRPSPVPPPRRWQPRADPNGLA
jgi:hypothetical protein